MQVVGYRVVVNPVSEPEVTVDFQLVENARSFMCAVSENLLDWKCQLQMIITNDDFSDSSVVSID